MKVKLISIIAMMVMNASSVYGQSGKLEGRLITFKQTYDGWWDAACDTLADGTKPRCYVQYVDAYSVPPKKFRAAMVDFIYRKTTDGKSQPVITFDVEPDLSFALNVKLAVVETDGTSVEIPVAQCLTGKCTYLGETAKAMLARWSRAKSLRLTIKEASGEIIVREWPLVNMGQIVKTIAEQRRSRGLP